MKRFSNTYIFSFTAIMVLIVASLLSIISIQLKPLQVKNIENRKKRDILASLHINTTTESANKQFNLYITGSLVVNTQGKIIQGVDAFDINLKKALTGDDEPKQLPVFTGTAKDMTRVYVFPLYGKGLWGDVYGYIALKSDLTTIYGINFGHEEETPGLGSQISDQDFQSRFVGKKIFSNTTFNPVQIVQQNVQANEAHRVNGISGATKTCDGVEYMIEDCLSLYLNFIKKTQKSEGM